MKPTKRGGHGAWRFLRRFTLLTALLTGLVAVLYWHEAGDTRALWVALAAGGVAGLMLLVEVVLGLGVLFSRHGVVGANTVIQVALAVALLVGGNVYSFLHHHRWDLTQDRTFTLEAQLPPELLRQLKQLRGETTIVVHLRHVPGGDVTDVKPDAYDAAATRKVQEKVRDLVEQFQGLGPRFRVVTLDVQEKGYEKDLKELTRNNKALRDAIDRSGENSVLFATGDKVQRLAFSQIYRLDKKASQAAEAGRGNLVLRPQGAGPFARRLLNVEEKQPRVAVAVIHPYLGLNSNRPSLNLAGVKKSLAAQGVEGFDLILKKPPPLGRWEPIAVTYHESQYEQLEREIATLDAALKGQEKAIKARKDLRDALAKMTLAELNKEYIVATARDGFRMVPHEDRDDYRAAGWKIGPVEERHRREIVEQLDETLQEIEALSKRDRGRKADKERELRRLPADDIAEQRRIAELDLKLKRLLADVDLLVVPRLSFMVSLDPDDVIPYWLHGVSREQTQAVKEFLKAGKPVLFLLGPSNVAPDSARPPDIAADELEPLLKELGFTLPAQAVIHDVETEAPPPERRGMFLIMPPPPEVPPVAFDWPAGAGYPRLGKSAGAEPAHPLRESLRLATRGVEKDLDIRVRFPRPVYYTPKGGPPRPEAVFMMTSPETWNESQPFLDEGKLPRFDGPGTKSRGGDPLLEERRGPFPVAAAAEVELPASWYRGEERPARPPTPRVAVVGAGDLFTGEALSPARDKVFLDLTNWLLGRDDELARETAPWQYPRVGLDGEQKRLWVWGAWLGLPAVCVYLGLVVYLLRRTR